MENKYKQIFLECVMPEFVWELYQLRKDGSKKKLDNHILLELLRNTKPPTDKW